MPIYGLWQDTGITGISAITDPSTLAAHSALLSPYLDPVRPIRHQLGVDDLQNPQVTQPLLFPDWATAANVMAQVNDPGPTDPPALPSEVPMERILLVLAMNGMAGDPQAFVNSLSEPAKTEAQIMLDRAPNLEVAGAFAQQFKAWKGLSDAAWGQLITTAVHMAL